MSADGATQTEASPAEDTTAQADPAAQAASAQAEEIKDPRAFLAAYERLKVEAAQARAELKKRELAEKQAEEAKLSDTERLTKRAAALEAELELERQEKRDRINQYEIQLRASRLGIVDPEAAVKLLDWSSITYADDGTPKDVDKALQALLKAKPYLAGQASPATSTANPATRAAIPGDRTYTRDELRDYEFYSKHRDEIVRAMREGRIVD